MSFHNVSLPEGIQYGSAVGTGFATVIQVTASGHETRVARQSQGRHRFTPRKQLQSHVEAMALKSFALARRGALHSFRLHDVLDHTTAADGRSAPTALDQVLGTGDGTEDTFQLVRVYNEGEPGEYPRTITLPVEDTILVAVAGTPTTAFTESNGAIILDTPPTLGQIVTAGCEFEVPVRFARGVDEWAALQIDDYDIWTAADLECIEVLDEVQNPEPWWAGGHKEWGSRDRDFTLTLKDGELHTVTATANIWAVLPNPEYHAGGPRVFVLHVKAGSTHTVQIRDDTGSTVGSAIGAGETVRIWLEKSNGTATWGVY